MYAASFQKRFSYKARQPSIPAEWKLTEHLKITPNDYMAIFRTENVPFISFEMLSTFNCLYLTIKDI